MTPINTQTSATRLDLTTLHASRCPAFIPTRQSPLNFDTHCPSDAAAAGVLVVHRAGSRQKNISGGTPPIRGERGEVWGGVSLPQPTKGSVGERCELPQLGPGRSPGQKRILAYFEGHRTLLFVPICRCFEFIKQCFMSHLGCKAEVLGRNCPLPQHRTATGHGCPDTQKLQVAAKVHNWCSQVMLLFAKCCP